MSTNFYWNPAGAYKNLCQLHIGKRSGGWSFSFQAHAFEGCPAEERAFPLTDTVCTLVALPELPALVVKSYADWKALLSIPGSTIEDEYGSTMPAEKFFEMVETDLHPVKGFWGAPNKRQPLKSHYDELVTKPHLYGEVNCERDWKDSEGYSFCLNEFS